MIVLRRYVLPAVAAAVAFVVLGFFFTVRQQYYIAGLIWCILAAYYMRFCDDILDYAADAAKGRALLPRWTLILLAVITVVGMIGISIGFSLWLLLIPPAVISVQFLLKERLRDVIKPLFLPSILIMLFLSVFLYHHFVIVLCVIAVAADVVILVMKRRKR